MHLHYTSGNGGIDSHAYKLAFFMLFFFPAVNGLEKLSVAAVGDVDCILLAGETSCCNGLSVSSAGLVLEL